MISGFIKKQNWFVILTSVTTIILAIIVLKNLSNILYLGIMQISLGVNLIASAFSLKRHSVNHQIPTLNLTTGILCIVIGIVIVMSK